MASITRSDEVQMRAVTRFYMSKASRRFASPSRK
jgi:hypothetical protein